MKKILFAITLILFLLLGCLQVSGSRPINYIKKNIPVNVSVYSSGIPHNNLDYIYIFIKDSKGRDIVSKGNISIVITDLSNNPLFKSTREITPSDFYKFNIGTGILIKIPLNEINTTRQTLHTGYVQVTFNPEHSQEHIKSKRAEMIIPTYSIKQLKELSEEQYLDNSKEVLIFSGDDNVSITLQTYGFYTDPFNASKTLFRVDFAIHPNIDTKYFGYPQLLIDQNNKLIDSYKGSTFIDKLIKGHNINVVLYFKIDDTTHPSKILFDKYLFDLDTNESYTYSDFLDNQYRDSATEFDKNYFEDGKFMINFKRYGFLQFPYDVYDLGDNYDPKKGSFRLDFYVSNTADIDYDITMYPSDLVGDHGNKYSLDYSSSSNLDFTMEPHSTQLISLIFNNVPRDSKTFSFSNDIFFSRKPDYIKDTELNYTFSLK